MKMCDTEYFFVIGIEKPTYGQLDTINVEIDEYMGSFLSFRDFSEVIQQ